MTIEELLDMRVGDVLQLGLGGIQLLRDKRESSTRIVLLAEGVDAEKVLALVTQLYAVSKEPIPC